MRYNKRLNKNNVSNKNKMMLVSLFSLFSLLIFVTSTSVIDYSYSIMNNESPSFALEIKDKNNQSTKYYGLFYKAWKCDNGTDKIKYGSYAADTKTCTIIPNFDENGIFTNPNGIKINKEQYNMIKYYYFNYYNDFKSNQEVEIAYRISSEINKYWWVNEENNKTINNDSSINLAIFGEIVNVDGVSELITQYNNKDYYKCHKSINNTDLFSEYNYLDNTCGSSWEKLTLDKKTCELAKNSTEFVKNYISITKLCE